MWGGKAKKVRGGMGSEWLMGDGKEGRDGNMYIPATSMPSTILDATALSTDLTPSLTVSVAVLRATEVVEKVRGAARARGARRRVDVLVRNDILYLVVCGSLFV